MNIKTNYLDTNDGLKSVIYDAGFTIKGIQFNNATDSVIKVYLGAVSLGAGGRVPDYVVAAFTFVQLPFHGNGTKVTVEYTTPTKQYDLVRIDIMDEDLKYYVATTPPTGGIGLAQNVAITNALIAGTNHIGQVGIDATNTTIDFATNGAAITGQVLDSGGTGVFGWLSQIRKRLTETLTVAISGSLPAGGNAIGTVGVTSLPAIPTGANTIGTVNVGTMPNITVSTLPALVASSAQIGHVVIDSMPPVTATNAAIRLTHQVYEGTIATAEVIFDMGANNVQTILYIANDDTVNDLFVSFDAVANTGAASNGLDGIIRIPAGVTITDMPQQVSKVRFRRAAGSARARFLGV